MHLNDLASAINRRSELQLIQTVVKINARGVCVPRVYVSFWMSVCKIKIYSVLLRIGSGYALKSRQ
jgi:hypothetical protein